MREKLQTALEALNMVEVRGKINLNYVLLAIQQIEAAMEGMEDG